MENHNNKSFGFAFMEVDHQSPSSSSYSSSSSSLVFLPLLFILYGYSYFLVKKLHIGFPRLIALFPVFYSLFQVPWCFPSSIFLRGLTSFFISWISSFKLLLFCFDGGDLILCNTYTDFVAVAALPLKFKQNGKHLEIVPILNQPHRATSLQVFWGKRWNRISSDVLRHTIYEPTLEGLKGVMGIKLGKMVALVTTLVVSGVMHEIMFYHMSCGRKPTWEVANFFILQGICMAFEILVKGFWIRTLSKTPISHIISVPFTLTFILLTSYWLLVLPVSRITAQGCNTQIKLYGEIVKCISLICSCIKCGSVSYREN